MTGTDQFREKLDELVRLAQKNGQRLMKAQVEEALRESGLDRKKMGLVFDYLEQMGIEVLDPGSASGDAGGRAGSISLAAYLRELEGIAPLPEEAEQSLFDEAVLGDREARNVLAERYLNTVCDLAGEFEHSAGSREKGVEAVDLIQEANIGLLLGLDAMEKQESLAAYRASLLNYVASHMEEALDALQEAVSSDRKIVNRMNRLAQAAHDLEEQLEHKPSLEELSAYLELPAEQITELLRFGGEDLRAEDL